MKIKVGDKILTARKWKGKDKKKFLQTIQKENIDPEDLQNTLLNALVYDCIEEDVVLSLEEFRYVLTRIRAESLGEDIHFQFYCKKCDKVFNKTYQLKDIIRYSFKELKSIKVQNIHIELGDVQNKEIYMNLIEKDEIYDFILRINSINGNDAFTLDELEEIIDNIDIDILEEIMEIWEASKFKIQDVNEVQCEHCSDIQIYEFDDLPDFFPSKWFE